MWMRWKLRADYYLQFTTLWEVWPCVPAPLFWESNWIDFFPKLVLLCAIWTQRDCDRVGLFFKVQVRLLNGISVFTLLEQVIEMKSILVSCRQSSQCTACYVVGFWLAHKKQCWWVRIRGKLGQTTVRRAALGQSISAVVTYTGATKNLCFLS